MTDPGPRQTPQQTPPQAGMPRWVKALAIAAVALLVLIVAMLLSGHGPGRHMHSLAPTSGPLGGLEVSAQAAGSTAPW